MISPICMLEDKQKLNVVLHHKCEIFMNRDYCCGCTFADDYDPAYDYTKNGKTFEETHKEWVAKNDEWVQEHMRRLKART